MNLDAILDEALAHAATRKVKSSPKVTPVVPLKKFSDPSNWQQHRTLALIHKASNGQETLLGNFIEYLHRSNGAIRKLERPTGPVEPTGREIVTGDWYLQTEQRKRVFSSALESRSMVLERITLPAMKVHSESVRVDIHLETQWIIRITLAEPTLFVSAEGKMLLRLPAGLDILDEMDYRQKAQIWTAIREQNV